MSYHTAERMSTIPLAVLTQYVDAVTDRQTGDSIASATDSLISR